MHDSDTSSEANIVCQLHSNFLCLLPLLFYNYNLVQLDLLYDVASDEPSCLKVWIWRAIMCTVH